MKPRKTAENRHNGGGDENKLNERNYESSEIPRMNWQY
jgi:hypothetical protein